MSDQSGPSADDADESTPWWRSPIYLTFLAWAALDVALAGLSEFEFTGYRVRRYASECIVILNTTGLSLIAGWMVIGTGEASRRWTTCWLLASTLLVATMSGFEAFAANFTSNLAFIPAAAICTMLGMWPILSALMIPYVVILSFRLTLVRTSQRPDPATWSQFNIRQLLGFTVICAVWFGLFRLSREYDPNGIQLEYWGFILLGILPPILCLAVFRQQLYPYTPIALAITSYVIIMPIALRNGHAPWIVPAGIAWYVVHLLVMRFFGYRLVRFRPDPHPAWRSQPMFLDLDNLPIDDQKATRAE